MCGAFDLSKVSTTELTAFPEDSDNPFEFFNPPRGLHPDAPERRVEPRPAPAAPAAALAAAPAVAPAAAAPATAEAGTAVTAPKCGRVAPAGDGTEPWAAER